MSVFVTLEVFENLKLYREVIDHALKGSEAVNVEKREGIYCNIDSKESPYSGMVFQWDKDSLEGDYEIAVQFEQGNYDDFE